MTEPKLHGTRARRVTFFEDRAEVERTARVELSAGQHLLALEGFTPLMDERTLRVAVREGDAKVISASVRRIPQALEEEIEALDARLLRAKEESRLERDAAGRARGTEQRGFALFDQWLEAARRSPETAGELDAQGWQAGFESLLGAVTTAGDEFVEHAFGQEQGELETKALSGRRRDEARDRPRGRLLVDLRVLASSRGTVELELSYRTPAALWRPTHAARLHRSSEDAKSATVELLTSGVAWQGTGEIWSSVEARFSTLRPAAAGRAPALTEDGESAAATSVSTTGEDEAGEERMLPVSGLLGASGDVIDELPGLYDGGEPVTFVSPRPITIPSDGLPHHFPLEQRSLDARLVRTVLPERSPRAHLMANLDWMHKTPILAGPLAIMRGHDYLGSSRIGLVMPGDRFEIGFGSEDGLLAERHVQDLRERVPLLGSHKLKRLITLSLENHTTTTRTLRVIERVPVSETADVDVVVTELGDWSAVDAQGFVHLDVSLPPSGRRELRLGYELRVRPKVELPF